KPPELPINIVRKILKEEGYQIFSDIKSESYTARNKSSMLTIARNLLFTYIDKLLSWDDVERYINMAYGMGTQDWVNTLPMTVRSKGE
ncbi:MAG: hypothetical protein ACFFCT_12090, partial [Candidatus Odinarchaeota archaeon]